MTRLKNFQIQQNITSTGVYTGGEITFGTPTGSPLLVNTFSVSAGSGVIVNNYTDPQNPTYEITSWPAFTDVVVTNLATNARTFLAINFNGSPSPSLTQQTTDYTQSEHRDKIILGVVGHTNNTNIQAVRQHHHAAFDASLRLSDLGHALGAFNIGGNVYGANGANLNLDKTVGESYSVGNNFHTDKANPDITTDIAETALEWRYSYQDGGSGYVLTSLTTAIVPDSWDDGDGSLGNVGTNTWSIQIIKFFPSTGHRIEYGQTTYGTVDDALSAVPDINHSHNPEFDDGIIRGYLIIRGGATDLSSAADARFIEAAKFSGTGGAPGDFFPGITDISTALQLTITDTEVTFENRIDSVLITEKNVTTSPTTTYTADLTTGTVFVLTLGGDTAITFSNVPGSGSPLIPSLSTNITFLLTQDAVGSPEAGTRTPSFPGSVLWEGGSVPAWTTVAGATDVVTMFTVDNGVTWYANLIGQGYA